MAVEITLGNGKPNFKTSTYRAARQLAGRANFQYLDNIAITPSFFRHFLERSGALSAKTNEDAQKRICRAELSPRELSQVKDAVYSLPAEGLNRLCLFVRSDEPWQGAGTGLGESYIAIRFRKSPKAFIDSIAYSIKLALASQFDELGNVAEFKRLKGAVEDFGILLMPVFASFYPNKADSRKIFAPSISVNFLGKAYGNALMQCSRGFSSKSYSGARAAEYARGRSFSLIDLDGNTQIDCTSSENATFHPGMETIPTECIERNRFHLTSGLDARVSKLLEGGNCYFEAVRKDHYPSKNPQWALTQHTLVDFPLVSRPPVDSASIVPLALDVVGMEVARTKGVHEVDPSEFQDSIDFNRENKGYLALCHLGSLDGTKDLPLSAFSNAGAVIFAYSQRENPTLSHLSGYLRELKIPVLITPDYGEFEKIKKHGNYVVYANEFLDGGFLARA